MKPASDLFYHVPLVRVHVLRDSAVPQAEALGETPEAIYNLWLNTVEKDPRHNGDVESIYCFHLNARRRVISMNLISQGTLDTLLVHPREVFRTAIVANAAAIILAHNHPSGDPGPSEADIKVTRDLIRAGQLLKIELLDHLVIGKATPERVKPWASLRELGYFYS